MAWACYMLASILLAINVTPWFWLVALVLLLWKLSEPPSVSLRPSPPLRRRSSHMRGR